MSYSKTHRGGDADRAGELVLPIAHLLGCELEILDDFLATLKEVFTAVGEGLLPRRPAQQPDIQGCLQCAEALTDDGLGDARRRPASRMLPASTIAINVVMTSIRRLAGFMPLRVRSWPTAPPFDSSQHQSLWSALKFIIPGVDPVGTFRLQAV